MNCYFLDEPSNGSGDLWLAPADDPNEPPKPSYLFPIMKIFLTQTADTIIHLRQIKHRKEAETIVEHLGYQDYSSQREQQFKQQSQQAANDQRAYQKNNGEAPSRPSASRNLLTKHQG